MSEARPSDQRARDARRSRPEKLAVIGPAGRSPTDSSREARALASRLYGLGLRPGDQAAVMSYNLPSTTRSRRPSNTCSRDGDDRIPDEAPEIQFIVENSDSKVLFFWHEFADRILPFRDSFRSLISEGFVVFGGSDEGARSYEELFATLRSWTSRS